MNGTADNDFQERKLLGDDGRIRAILFHPVQFPYGLEPVRALERLVEEFALETMTHPRRETSLVMTKLEEAYLWECRRIENMERTG